MTNITHFKEKLETELAQVKEELQTVGRVNPTNPKEWEAIPRDTNIDRADEEEVANKIDEYEENAGILKELETRYSEIEEALKRIQENTYGTCEVGGEKIEEERLEANPAARTCIKHK